MKFLRFREKEIISDTYYTEMLKLEIELKKLRLEAEKKKLDIAEICKENIEEAFKFSDSAMVASIAEILKSV